MTLFSGSHEAPMGIGDPSGMGTGERFIPLRFMGTERGMRNGERGRDGGRPPGSPRPVDVDTG